MTKTELLILASNIQRALPVCTTWSLLHSCLHKFYFADGLGHMERIYFMCHYLPLAEHYTIRPRCYYPTDEDILRCTKRRDMLLWNLGLGTSQKYSFNEELRASEEVEKGYWFGRDRQNKIIKEISKMSVVDVQINVQRFIDSCVLIQKAQSGLL